MQTINIFSAPILFLYTRNYVCWVYLCGSIRILSLLLNAMLIVDKHCSDVCCDEFSVPQTDCRVNKQKNTVTQKILFAISMGENSLS